MNTFEKIQNAAKAVGLKAYPHVYNGSDTKWITYQTMTEQGALFGDDEPGAVVNRVMVNLFVPERMNYLPLKNQLRRALFDQGLTWPEIVNTAVETDRKIRQVTFECEDDDDF